MGLKTSLTVAFAAGAAVYGVQETKQQTFDICASADTGLVQVINPNRYFGRNNMYINEQGVNGRSSQYIFNGRDPMGHGLLNEAQQLCSTGKPSEQLRPRR